VAALRASKNLNIPFNALKAQMTGPAHASLGQAIHALRPSANATAAATQANAQATSLLPVSTSRTSRR
jgi:hypothetical protein